jgi:hypothetical protein
VNEELAARYADDLRQTLGWDGRMISWSKSGYRERHLDHVAIFNANVSLEQGKIWHGDVDLTLDEQKLHAFSERIGETVFLLYEMDGRFENEGQPLLERAIFSVTPTGHTKFDHRSYERAADGTLRLRPPEPETRRRWRWQVLKHRPRLWRLWRFECRRTIGQVLNDRDRCMLVYFGARDSGKTPLHVLGFMRGERWRMVGFEWTWYPGGRDEWRAAPRPLISFRRELRIRRLNCWLTIVVWPGFSYELLAGARLTRWSGQC